MSVNKVILLGNLGDDVKLHYFEGGGCVGKFPLATNESYTDKNGQKVTKTEWHSIVCRNKTAETLEKYTKKGDQLYVEGKITTKKWQDTNGQDRYSTEIDVFSFSFIANGQTTTKSDTSANTNQETHEAEAMDEEIDNELPF